jgi:multiple sugar transport system permease protein/cellobiose transport system permease protein
MNAHLINSKKLRKIPLLLIMIVISLVALAPFWIMMMMGTYKTNSLYAGIKLVPGNFVQGNLKTLSQIAIDKFYLNSLYVSLSCSLLTVLVCSMCGYALAKYRFKGREILGNIVLLTLMIPSQLSLVGFIIEINKIGWLNTHLPLIIPPAASAFGVFWIRQYTKSAIPDSVIESARLDGCGEFMIFLRIAFPFIGPACITLLMLSFLASWNSFFIPMIVLSSLKLYTIPLGIRQLATQFRTDVAAQILGMTIATIPMLAMFAVFSKNLISGLASAAIKE